MIDKDTITIGECTHPAGHCYGNDGGTGVPENMKVTAGQGGDVDVATFSQDKKTILKLEVYSKCQYCLKYSYVQDKEVSDVKI